MTDRLRAAAQAALEALESVKDSRWNEDSVAGRKLLADLRAALAERGHLRDATEMIGWLAWSDRLGYTFWESLENAEASTAEDFPVCPVYSRPIRREWQGLTDEEIAEIHRTCKYDASPWPLSRAIEAKLKEKNHGI